MIVWSTWHIGPPPSVAAPGDAEHWLPGSLSDSLYTACSITFIDHHTSSSHHRFHLRGHPMTPSLTAHVLVSQIKLWPHRGYHRNQHHNHDFQGQPNHHDTLPISETDSWLKQQSETPWKLPRTWLFSNYGDVEISCLLFLFDIVDNLFWIAVKSQTDEYLDFKAVFGCFGFSSS